MSYPAMLTNGPQTKRHTPTTELAAPRRPRISRADVAHFMLNEAQLSTPGENCAPIAGPKRSTL